MASFWIVLVGSVGLICYLSNLIAERDDRKTREKALRAAQKAAKGKGFRS